MLLLTDQGQQWKAGGSSLPFDPGAGRQLVEGVGFEPT
jgi:hypothetical protein